MLLTQFFNHSWNNTGRQKFSGHTLSPKPSPPELKDILHKRGQTFHTGHFRNRFDPAHAVFIPPDLNNKMKGRNHLLSNGAGRQFRARKKHHGFQPRQSIPGRIGVDRAHATFMTGIHGLQHIQGFRSPDLPDDDPVRPHP